MKDKPTTIQEAEAYYQELLKKEGEENGEKIIKTLYLVLGETLFSAWMNKDQEI